MTVKKMMNFDELLEWVYKEEAPFGRSIKWDESNNDEWIIENNVQWGFKSHGEWAKKGVTKKKTKKEIQNTYDEEICQNKNATRIDRNRIDKRIQHTGGKAIQIPIEWWADHKSNQNNDNTMEWIYENGMNDREQVVVEGITHTLSIHSQKIHHLPVPSSPIE